MHDLRAIREDPNAFDAGLARRGLQPVAAMILALDERRRAVDYARAGSAGAAQRGLEADRRGDGQRRHCRRPKRSRPKSRRSRTPSPRSRTRTASSAPNSTRWSPGCPTFPPRTCPKARTRAATSRSPAGASCALTSSSRRSTPTSARRWGSTSRPAPRCPARASPSCVARWRGCTARSAQFMLDFQTARTRLHRVRPPLLVRDEAVFGTGQLPKFAEDLFKTTDGRWLIPTAEVSLTNSVREQILADGALPDPPHRPHPVLPLGSRRGGQGYARLHPPAPVREGRAGRDLPPRRIAGRARAHGPRPPKRCSRRWSCPIAACCCAPATWASTATKTFDLEVWLPGQNAYREISSVSNCGDFQARRMNARYRPEGAEGHARSSTRSTARASRSGGRWWRCSRITSRRTARSPCPAALHAVHGRDQRLVPPDAHPAHQRRRHPRARASRCSKRSPPAFGRRLGLAPSEEQSGAGHSLTLPAGPAAQHGGAALLGHRHADRCGDHGAAEGARRYRRPDLVLSGVNRGANLGDDVTYSGTVSAAIEARARGHSRAIALSQAMRAKAWATPCLSPPRRSGENVLAPLLDLQMPERTLVNINFPALPADQVQGHPGRPPGLPRLCARLGGRGIDPRGHPYYWFGLGEIEHTLGHGTDLEAVSRRLHRGDAAATRPDPPRLDRRAG